MYVGSSLCVFLTVFEYNNDYYMYLDDRVQVSTVNTLRNVV